MLEKHYFNQEDRIASGNECHYFGHLANEKGACVSMTGCLGSEDILFTIMSVHATDSPYFEWTKEGEVNAIDLEQIVSGNRKSFNLESWLGFNFWDGVHHKDPKQCKC